MLRQNELKEAKCRDRVPHPMAELLIRVSQPSTCPKISLPSSNHSAPMSTETRSSIREELKIANGLQRNYHNAARCITSDLFWFAVRPLLISVPRSIVRLVPLERRLKDRE